MTFDAESVANGLSELYLFLAQYVYQDRRLPVMWYCYLQTVLLAMEDLGPLRGDLPFLISHFEYFLGRIRCEIHRTTT